MKQVISLDGVPVLISDVGVSNGAVQVMQPPQDEGIQNVVQPTELGETLKELNNDELEGHTRQSGIDLRARLHPFEVDSIVALDSLVSFKILPPVCLGFTRQKKRLSVSIKGLGRKEIVDIVGGKRDHDADSGFGGKMKGFMGMNKQ